jgi:hypothetical protein
MASIINASSTGSGGIVQTADASGVLQLQSNGTVALTTSGANVGFGTTSPSTKVTVQSTNVDGLMIATDLGDSTTSSRLFFQTNSALADFYYNNTSGLVWNTGATLGSSSGTGRFFISPAGYVTKPYQPAFFAYSSGTSMTSGNKVQFDSAPLNVGNCFNTSTNTFTAPIAGNYFIAGLVRYNQVGVTYSQTSLYINNNNVYQGHYTNTTNAASTYSGVIASGIIGLSAGDTVYVLGTISGGGTFTFSGSESCFYGYLLG